MNYMQVFIPISLLVLLSPIILCFVSLLLNFWTRNRYNFTLGGDLFQFKWRRFNKGYALNVHDGDYVAYFIMEAGLLTVFSLGFGLLCNTFGLLMSSVVLSSLLGVILLPRLILDIGNSIKYNFKTTKADEIEELKKQVAKLERNL